MKLTPIVVLVDSDTRAKLLPLVDDLTDRFSGVWDDDSPTAHTFASNGWTFEAIAWGLVLAAAAKLDLTIDPDAPLDLPPNGD